MMGVINSLRQTVRGTRQRKRLAVGTFMLAIVASSHPALATIDNTATASGTYNATTATSAPSSISVPVTPQAKSMAVTKTASDTTDVVAGQVITYTYTVTNTGSVTLNNVSPVDSHNGSGPPPSPGSEILTNDGGTPGDSSDGTANNGVWSVLAPGDTISFTATYTVTQDDVDTKQ